MKLEQVKSLSDEELSIKVAELCGWTHESKRVHQNDELLSIMAPKRQYRWLLNGEPQCVWQDYDEDAFRCIPEYCIDLNAMHEAEKLVVKERMTTHYSHYLYAGHMQGWTAIHATARQRAEAFYLTMEREEMQTLELPESIIGMSKAIDDIKKHVDNSMAVPKELM